MALLNHIEGILGISCGLWSLYCLYSILNVQAFIVNRYEEETKLLDTLFFKNHATFTRYLPGFLSSAIYSGHFLMCIWGWSIFGGKNAFNDIDTPEMILRHFSTKEILRIKRYAISMFILLIHFITISIVLHA